MTRRKILTRAMLVGFVALTGIAAAQDGELLVVVMETEKGTIEFELYPRDAPRSVEQITRLIGRNFYNGQRIIRVGGRSVSVFVI